jgi:hypothetical protein
MSDSQDIKAKLLEILSLMDKKEVESLLSQLNTVEHEPEAEKPVKKGRTSTKAVVDDKFRVVRSDGALGSQRTSVKASKNSWSDPGESRDESFDPSKFVKVPRNRQPPKKITKNCSICGKVFETQESLVFGSFFRCDRCTGK